MPTRVAVDDDEQQIQDLIKEMRRLRSRLATTGVKGTHDEFTAAATPATTYTLTYIPLTGTCLMALNGHVQREGTDYTCDYTTGIVTVSATQASGDKITFRYLVTDWLVARSLTPELGPITDTFNRADASSLGTTSDGSATWTDLSSPPRWTILSNKAHCTGASGALYVAVINTGHADGTLQLDVAQISALSATGLAFRVTDLANGYNIQITSGTNNTQVYRYIANTAVQMGASFTVALGDVMTVIMSGTSFTIQVNGSTVTTFTDSTYTTNTKHGICATGGLDVDNFNWNPA